MVAGLETTTSGTILIGGRDVTRLDPKDRNIAMVFQNYALYAHKNVYGNLDFGLRMRGVPKQEAERRVREAAEILGLTDLLHRKPKHLSGGQRQRVGIARALAMEPEFIICDEAVSALDVSIQAQVINLLEELREEFNLTYLFISHDLSVVRHICHRVAVMYLGHMVELSDCDELFDHPLHPYSQALLNAVPIPDPDLEKTREHTIIKGEIPSPINPPPGCVFHPRCPLAVDSCKKNIPDFREVRKGHWVACTEV